MIFFTKYGENGIYHGHVGMNTCMNIDFTRSFLNFLIFIAICSLYDQVLNFRLLYLALDTVCVAADLYWKTFT